MFERLLTRQTEVEPFAEIQRRDVGGVKPASLAVLCVGVAGFAALLLAVSSDLKLDGLDAGLRPSS